jgi:hypothetical protein
MAAVGLPVAADRQIGVADFAFSGRPLGYLGPKQVGGGGAFDAVFDVPPAHVLQPRANKKVQLLYPGLLLRVNMKSRPLVSRRRPLWLANAIGSLLPTSARRP